MVIKSGHTCIGSFSCQQKKVEMVGTSSGMSSFEKEVCVPQGSVFEYRDGSADDAPASITEGLGDANADAVVLPEQLSSGGKCEKEFLQHREGECKCGWCRFIKGAC